MQLMSVSFIVPFGHCRRHCLSDLCIFETAASNEGFKIMSMLYLTPVLPLGLVSYMCGTTSMRLASFAAAKIASLPLYLLYTFIGASAHSFMKHGGTEGDSVASALEGTKKIEENQGILVAGLGKSQGNCSSFVVRCADFSSFSALHCHDDSHHQTHSQRADASKSFFVTLSCAGISNLLPIDSGKPEA